MKGQLAFPMGVPEPPDTLAEARRVWRSEDPPKVCPCCGRPSPTTYHRRLNGSMVRTLVAIVRAARESATGWVHAISVLVALPLPPRQKAALTGGVHAKLVHWGLLEEEASPRGDGTRHRGYFRPSILGWEFVAGRARVHRVALVRGGVVVGYEGDEVAIADVMGENFSLAQLLEESRP